MADLIPPSTALKNGGNNETAGNETGSKNKQPRENDRPPSRWSRLRKKLSPSQWSTCSINLGITIWVWICLLESHDLTHLIGYFVVLLFLYAGQWYYLIKL